MWVLFSLSAAIFAALVVVLSKAGIQKVNPVMVFGIEAICMMLITWSIIFIKGLQQELLTIDRRIWLFLIAAGILTTFSSLASFHSLKLGHASRTASFEKISLVFSVLLSVIFLKDKFNWQVVMGVLLMVAGTLFIAFSDPAK
jgi:bacterial/archaeal transporter family protein